MRRIPNPDMLILAREARGYTLTNLAGAINVSVGLLSKIEHGIVHATDAHINAIATELEFPVSLFYRPEHVRGTDSPCLHHRKRKTMPKLMLKRIEAQMHLAQLQVTRMLEDLDIEGALTLATLDPDEYGGPQAVAQALRALWRLPSGPIPNLVQVLEAAGAVVLLRDFGAGKLDGMSSWAGGPAVFYINSRIPTDRMRWTLAHELGHLVMHPQATSGDQEDEADQFALEFLAPEAELKHDLRSLTFARLPALKMHWRISMIALVRAAGRFDAVPAPKLKSMYVQISRSGWRTKEPFEVSPESPTIIDKAMQVHLREHGYSQDELASVVDLRPDEFSKLYAPKEERPRLRAV